MISNAVLCTLKPSSSNASKSAQTSGQKIEEQ